MKTILIFLLCTASLFAQESLDDLVKKLGNDDFDVRVETTKKLGAYPSEFAKKFIEIASMSDDPEIAHRLRQAARFVFESKIGSQNDEWLLMHGSFCLEGHEVSQIKPPEKKEGEEPPPEGSEGYYGYGYNTVSVGIYVNWVYEGGSSDGKITRWDIIEEVEGLTLNDILYHQKNIKVGQEYKFRFRRYKEAGEILKDDGYVNPEIKYEIMTVTLKAGYKNANPDEEQKLMDKLWAAWSKDLIK
jgi:hypothetical protein